MINWGSRMCTGTCGAFSVCKRASCKARRNTCYATGHHPFPHKPVVVAVRDQVESTSDCCGTLQGKECLSASLSTSKCVALGCGRHGLPSML